jgi:hypothetical protein
MPHHTFHPLPARLVLLCLQHLKQQQHVNNQVQDLHTLHHVITVTPTTTQCSLRPHTRAYATSSATSNPSLRQRQHLLQPKYWQSRRLLDTQTSTSLQLQQWLQHLLSLPSHSLHPSHAQPHLRKTPPRSQDSSDPPIAVPLYHH